MPIRHDMLSAALLLVTLAGSAQAANTPASAWRNASQMILVTTSGWNVDHGTLRTFTRVGDAWREVRSATPVTIGKNGAGWGLGLSPSQQGGPVKREGDNRSPAGVFRIGEVFGYAAHGATAMPYRAMTADDYCMDVSGSAQYNRIVDSMVVGADAVKGSTEPMRRDLHANGDQRYRLGFVIEQNRQAVPNGGSCIFAHLWKSPTDATAGCTAMTPPVMQSLLAWLKPQDHPVFVLLPQAEYDRLRAEWQLPAIAVADAAR